MSDERIWRYLDFAKKASEFSDFHQHQLGCVIVCGKSVVGAGWNANTTHVVQAKYNQYRKLYGNCLIHKAHAEIRAIQSIQHLNVDWRKATLYIYREHKNGNPALSRPCAACMALIKSKNIRKVVYTNDNDQGYTIEMVG